MWHTASSPGITKSAEIYRLLTAHPHYATVKKQTRQVWTAYQFTAMAEVVGEGWKVVQRKDVDLRSLPAVQREREELRHVREWDKSASSWSGQ